MSPLVLALVCLLLAGSLVGSDGVRGNGNGGASGGPSGGDTEEEISDSFDPDEVEPSETEKCGAHRCGLYAVCHRGVCQCPYDRPVGDPQANCRPDNQISCALVGDPRVTAFDGSIVNLNFPCEYYLAEYLLSIKTRIKCPDAKGSYTSHKIDTYRNKLKVTVRAHNEISPKGTYYVAKIRVTFSIQVLGTTFFTYEIEIGGGKASLTYRLFGKDYVVKVLREDSNRKLLFLGKTSLGMYLYYNKNSAIWSIFTPFAGALSITFKEWDPSHENQFQKPHVSIAFNEEDSSPTSKTEFPGTYCGGIYHDEPDYHIQECKRLGFSKFSDCLASVHYNNSDAEGQETQECINSFKSYRNISPGIRKLVIERCSPVLSTFKNCVLEAKKSVAEVYDLCSKAIADGQSTDEVKKIIHGKGKGCDSFNPDK